MASGGAEIRGAMKELRFAIFGTGFWSRFQLAAWHALPGVRCVGLYNRTLAKAEALGRAFGVEVCQNSPERLLDEVPVDFVDIITDVDTHAPLTKLALERGLPVICQKPMAPTLPVAREMEAAARAAGKSLFIHENWRWQRPIRALKEHLDRGEIGQAWRARVIYNCSFPVFDNQPFLRDLEQFILMDMGTHILDVVRYLFGEAESLGCQTFKVNRGIRGEDAATVMLKMRSGLGVSCEISYASRVPGESFPQVYVLVEGEDASLYLGKDYQVTRHTKEETTIRAYPPARHAWADPAYDLVHASIHDCNRNFLAAFRGEAAAETTAADNLKTLELVFAAYEAARTGQVVRL